MAEKDPPLGHVDNFQTSPSMQAMSGDILLDIPTRLLGFPQAPDWPLQHPVEHA